MRASRASAPWRASGPVHGATPTPWRRSSSAMETSRLDLPVPVGPIKWLCVLAHSGLWWTGRGSDMADDPSHAQQSFGGRRQLLGGAHPDYLGGLLAIPG